MTRLTIIIVLMIFIAAPAPTQRADQEPGPAPQFALKDLSGKSVSLSDYKGKVVLLNFWATWCVPCRTEIPDLVRLQKEYQSRGLQILGITYPAYTRRGVQQLVDRLKVNYPILLADRSLADMYGVEEVLPTTVVIDREGKIRGRILGILEAEEFDQSVKPLLDR